MPQTSAALASYRHLLRAIGGTFGGDAVAIGRATTEARKLYEANRKVTSESEIRAKIAEALDAASFIKENIVQTTKSSCGTYEVEPGKAKHLQEMAPEIVTTKHKNG